MSDSRTKHFTPEAVAASHVAIAQCVSAFVSSPDARSPRTREAFAEVLDEQFQGLFRPGYGLSREDEHDLHRIWEALRRTLRSPILEAYRPESFPKQ